MSRIEIRTPSRLHFGLIEIKLGEPHCFGGLGMMLESPSFHLTIQSAKQFDASRTGDWEPRITKVAHHWASCRKRTSLPNVSIQILKELPPHAGLGSGTQLACGIVSLLDAAIWQRETEDDSNQSGSNRLTDLDRVSNSTPDIREWMQLVNRGARSKIGLAGFLHGGAIYDAGFSANSIPDGKPFHFEHIEIPDNWRAILVRPRLAETISGERETEFFVQCESIPNPNRSRMLQLLDQVILPALRQGDLDLMSDSLFDYGCLAGDLFRKVQHGSFRTAEIADRVASLRSLGLRSVGQSSWGPTVFGIAEDQEHALHIARRWNASSNDSELTISRFCNQAARVVEVP